MEMITYFMDKNSKSECYYIICSERINFHYLVVLCIVGPKGLAKILRYSLPFPTLHIIVKLRLAILYSHIKGLLVGLNNPV